MTEVRRLGALGVVFTLAAILTSPLIWGSSNKEGGRDSGTRPARTGTSDVDTLMAGTKFTDQQVVAYENKDRETVFGWQIKARAEAQPRPRDIAVVIDTSASQAKGPLNGSLQLLDALSKQMGDRDRLSVWTSNLDAKNVTRGFVEKTKVEAAIKPLKEDYPSGAANLKKVLPQVVKGFENERGRQRLVLFLGDGMSVAGPLEDADRVALCEAMIKLEVAFFPVPLGERLDPVNLHTLASGTGGMPLRIQANEKPDDVVKRMLAAIDLPIFYPTGYKTGGQVQELYPTKLPPLRTDVPTLVVGKARAATGKLTLDVEGTVADKQATFALEQTLPEAVSDNFFLAGMFTQWKELKDRPALLQADRALAFAFEENHLAVCEMVALAETALEQNKLEEATKLAEQALDVHPASTDATAVIRVVRKLQEGKITRQKLLELLRPTEKDRVVLIDNKGVRKTPVSREKLRELAQQQDPPADPMGGGQPPPGRNDEDFIREVKQRQAIEDQRTADIVNEEIRQANRILRENPDEAYERLKRALDNIRDNPDISQRARQNLSDRLRDSLRSAQVQGATIKRDLADRARAEAGRVAAASREQEQRDAEARIAARMKTLKAMVEQARLEVILSGSLPNREAAIEAVDQLRKDVLSEGREPPQALRAAYHMAQADFHITEARELERRRQRNWLMVLLSVERSHIPFSDEPPIHFPPRATWRKLTEQRKAKYESSSLGADTGDRSLGRLLRVLSTPMTFDALEDPTITLELFLNSLSTKMSRPDDQPPFYLTFEVNEAAFKAEQVMDVLAQPIAERKIPKMVNVSLSAYLRRVLERINVPSKAVYIIRRDVDLPLQFSIDPSTAPPPRYIVEITTGQFAVAEKAVRVYPVADLVIPIPQSINQNSLNQQLQLFGAFQQAGAFGVAGVQFGGGFQFGFQGGLNLGGQFGLNGGLAAGINGVQGVAGVQGGQVQGFNFGVGGGQFGFGGGQLGQFGNLGGQFGLQGGDTSSILITLITQVVGSPRDWAPPIQFPGGMQDPNLPADDPNANLEGNQLGYYPPALALVVKGTSRIHTRVRPPSVGGGGGGGLGALGAAPAPLREGIVVIGGPGMPHREAKKDDKGVAQKPDPKKDPKKDPRKDVDPRKVWQDALAQGTTDPGMIIATTDFLIEHRKFDHAAEFLKANLRQGVVVRPWVYESLALVLREAGGSTEEIERAEVSVTDLEPQDAQGYLGSAKAMADLKNYDRALAFCRQAAQLEPNLPDCYADALNYAEQSQDPAAMRWAARSLLQQDWPFKNQELHELASTKVDALSKVLKDRPEDVAQLKEVAKVSQRRDLVIKGSWQGKADLDLRIEEPSGSTCTAVTRQTVGGGAMTGDILGDDNTETYVAAEAFPGKYTITVERAWGKSVGDKCQLQIITHQGTDQEHVKLVTVELDKNAVITFNLEEGRRKELAIVPSTSPTPPGVLGGGAGIDRVAAQLRALTEEDMPRGFGGGAGSTIGTPIEQAKLLQAAARGEDRGVPRRYQNRVSPFTSVTNSANLSVQATIAPDRRSVRLSMNASFNGVTGTQLRPYVSSSILPGRP